MQRAAARSNFYGLLLAARGLGGDGEPFQHPEFSTDIRSSSPHFLKIRDVYVSYLRHGVLLAVVVQSANRVRSLTLLR